jgi:ATP-dependent DNA helicase RecQ
MGIDKSNVRWIYNLPKTLKVIIIGRAGRRFTLWNYFIRKLRWCNTIAKFASQGLNAEVQLAKLDRMKQYADALSCRRKYYCPILVS